MKLFLCGGGSGKQILLALNKFSKQLDKNKPILYIPLAMDEKKYKDCYTWFKEEIKYMKINNFKMVKSSLELSKINFDEYSALFIGGGNTYKLLNDIKSNGNYEKILKYLNNGGIIFGGSAGAIIFGKDIDGCMTEDSNIVNLNDTEGFNILKDYSFLCHLNNKHFKKNKDYLFHYTKDKKLIYLPENDVIYINDDRISLIGNHKYIVFDKGRCEYHTSSNIKKDFNIKN